MRRISRLGMAAALLVCTLSPRMAPGQVGGYGGRGRGMGGRDRYAPSVPKLPGPELDGPPDSATARELLGLTAEQAARSAQAYASFMVPARPQRDSARAATDKMNDRLDSGDLAAATFYAERLQDLGKYLKSRQDKFEDDLKRLLTSDEMKSYRRWKDEQDRAAEAKRREDALRWREAAFGGERPSTAPERKTVIGDAAGVAHADPGPQAVRGGRTRS